MVEVTPRGGDEVTVIFTDNKSRVVRLANENKLDLKMDAPKSSLRYDVPSLSSSYSAIDERLFSQVPKNKLLRTVSATVNPHYNHTMLDHTLRPVCAQFFLSYL